MQAQAYEGYFENGDFHTAGKTIRIPDHHRVFITIFDEIVKVPKSKDKKIFFDELNRLGQEAEVEENERRTAWLSRLHEAVDSSLDEDLPDILRQTTMREPINLSC